MSVKTFVYGQVFHCDIKKYSHEWPVPSRFLPASEFRSWPAIHASVSRSSSSSCSAYRLAERIPSRRPRIRMIFACHRYRSMKRSSSCPIPRIGAVRRQAHARYFRRIEGNEYQMIPELRKSIRLLPAPRQEQDGDGAPAGTSTSSSAAIC
jgi:hypothetical protein